MANTRVPSYKGRSLGIAALTAAQIFIGAIHLLFGFLLLYFDVQMNPMGFVIYDVYTVTYAALIIVFATLFWRWKRSGWIGTIAVSLFVIVTDSLTVANLPSIPGIPKGAAFLEVSYSLLVVFYLLTPKIRKKYLGF
jgi:hypothetical protein